MKKILLFFIILFLSNTANSSNLVFNQVITYSGTSSYNSTNGVILVTLGVVPSGKVWKIENYSLTNSNAFQLINGLRTSVFNLQNFNNFWLKAGDSIGIEQFSSYTNYHVSIIEYNIVP
jgi:hypothetical protein